MKRIIQLIITALLFIISQISCSDDSSTEPESWGGSMNSSGYPEVSGTYLFITDQVTYTCSDGGTGNIPPFSYELQIVQTQGNMIEAVRSDPDPPLPDGFTVFSASDLEGTIQIPDGNSVAFVMNQNIIFNVNTSEYVGEVVAIYNYSGTFTPYSWEGDYAYTLQSDGICTYSATFSGDKIQNIIID